MIKNILLLVLILLVVYILIAYIQTRKLIDIGNELAANAKAFSRDVADAEYSFLVIGDSSAVGTGASKPAHSTAGRLGADYPTASITNLAVNGSKTAELIPRMEKLNEGKYDLVLIQIGGNDIVRHTNLVELEESINRVLELATDLSDNVVLLTSGNVGTSKLLPAGTRWQFTRRTRSVREIFMPLAAEHNVHYIDLFREAADDPFADNPTKYYANDLFHPSSEGYGDWYSFIRTELESISL